MCGLIYLEFTRVYTILVISYFSLIRGDVGTAKVSRLDDAIHTGTVYSRDNVVSERQQTSNREKREIMNMRQQNTSRVKRYTDYYKDVSDYKDKSGKRFRMPTDYSGFETAAVAPSFSEGQLGGVAGGGLEDSFTTNLIKSLTSEDNDLLMKSLDKPMAGGSEQTGSRRHSGVNREGVRQMDDRNTDYSYHGRSEDHRDNDGHRFSSDHSRDNNNRDERHQGDKDDEYIRRHHYDDENKSLEDSKSHEYPASHHNSDFAHKNLDEPRKDFNDIKNADVNKDYKSELIDRSDSRHTEDNNDFEKDSRENHGRHFSNRADDDYPDQHREEEHRHYSNGPGRDDDYNESKPHHRNNYHDNYADRYGGQDEFSSRDNPAEDYEKNLPEYNVKETKEYRSSSSQGHHHEDQDYYGGNHSDRNYMDREREDYNKHDRRGEKKEVTSKGKGPKTLFNGEELEEYRHYPNEYLTKEESRAQTEEHVPKLKDAVKIDAEGIKSELNVINEADKSLGSTFEGRKHQHHIHKEVDAEDYGDKKIVDKISSVKHADRSKYHNYEHENKHGVQEKRKNLATTEDDDDMDQETKELLNIDVRANGKIVDTNSQRELPDKEAIFNKESLVPENQQNTSQMKNSTSADEEAKIVDEIADIEKDLQSSLTKSKDLVKDIHDDEFESSHLIVRKGSLPQFHKHKTVLPTAMLSVLANLKRNNIERRTGNTKRSGVAMFYDKSKTKTRNSLKSVKNNKAVFSNTSLLSNNANKTTNITKNKLKQTNISFKVFSMNSTLLKNNSSLPINSTDMINPNKYSKLGYEESNHTNSNHTNIQINNNKNFKKAKKKKNVKKHKPKTHYITHIFLHSTKKGFTKDSKSKNSKHIQNKPKSVHNNASLVNTKISFDKQNKSISKNDIAQIKNLKHIHKNSTLKSPPPSVNKNISFAFLPQKSSSDVMPNFTTPELQPEKQNETVAVKKASLNPIYNGKYESSSRAESEAIAKRIIKGLSRFSRLQNEILVSMFRSSPAAAKRLGLGNTRTGSIRSLADAAKFQLGFQPQKIEEVTGEKHNAIARKHKNGSTAVRKENILAVPRSMAGAISYTDRYGQENTYMVGTEHLNYDDARRQCIAKGGDLTSVNDRLEQEFIAANVVSETDNYWIGLDDRDQEGTFAWVDNVGQTISYSHWAKGQPDDGVSRDDVQRHDEDCTVIDAATARWNDVNCYMRHRYICKNTNKVTRHKPVDRRSKDDPAVQEDDSEDDSQTLSNEALLKQKTAQTPYQPSLEKEQESKDETVDTLSNLKNILATPLSSGTGKISRGGNGGPTHLVVKHVNPKSDDELTSATTKEERKASNKDESDKSDPDKITENTQEDLANSFRSKNVKTEPHAVKKTHHKKGVKPDNILEIDIIRKPDNEFKSKSVLLSRAENLLKDILDDTTQKASAKHAERPEDVILNKYKEIQKEDKDEIVANKNMETEVLLKQSNSSKELQNEDDMENKAVSSSSTNAQLPNNVPLQPNTNSSIDSSKGYVKPELDLVRQICAQTCKQSTMYSDGESCGKGCARSLLTMSPSTFIKKVSQLREQGGPQMDRIISSFLIDEVNNNDGESDEDRFKPNAPIIDQSFDFTPLRKAAASRNHKSHPKHSISSGKKSSTLSKLASDFVDMQKSLRTSNDNLSEESSVIKNEKDELSSKPTIGKQHPAIKLLADVIAESQQDQLDKQMGSKIGPGQRIIGKPTSVIKSDGLQQQAALDNNDLQQPNLVSANEVMQNNNNALVTDSVDQQAGLINSITQQQPVINNGAKSSPIVIKGDRIQTDNTSPVVSITLANNRVLPAEKTETLEDVQPVTMQKPLTIKVPVGSNVQAPLRVSTNDLPTDDDLKPKLAHSPELLNALHNSKAAGDRQIVGSGIVTSTGESPSNSYHSMAAHLGEISKMTHLLQDVANTVLKNPQISYTAPPETNPPGPPAVSALPENTAQSGGLQHIKDGNDSILKAAANELADSGIVKPNAQHYNNLGVDMGEIDSLMADTNPPSPSFLGFKNLLSRFAPTPHPRGNMTLEDEQLLEGMVPTVEPTLEPVSVELPHTSDRLAEHVGKAVMKALQKVNPEALTVIQSATADNSLANIQVKPIIENENSPLILPNRLADISDLMGQSALLPSRPTANINLPQQILSQPTLADSSAPQPALQPQLKPAVQVVPMSESLPKQNEVLKHALAKKGEAMEKQGSILQQQGSLLKEQGSLLKQQGEHSEETQPLAPAVQLLQPPAPVVQQEPPQPTVSQPVSQPLQQAPAQALAPATSLQQPVASQPATATQPALQPSLSAGQATAAGPALQPLLPTALETSTIQPSALGQQVVPVAKQDLQQVHPAPIENQQLANNGQSAPLPTAQGTQNLVGQSGPLASQTNSLLQQQKPSLIQQTNPVLQSSLVPQPGLGLAPQKSTILKKHFKQEQHGEEEEESHAESNEDKVETLPDHVHQETVDEPFQRSRHQNQHENENEHHNQQQENQEHFANSYTEALVSGINSNVEFQSPRSPALVMSEKPMKDIQVIHHRRQQKPEVATSRYSSYVDAVLDKSQEPLDVQYPRDETRDISGLTQIRPTMKISLHDIHANDVSQIAHDFMTQDDHELRKKGYTRNALKKERIVSRDSYNKRHKIRRNKIKKKHEIKRNRIKRLHEIKHNKIKRRHKLER